MDGITTEFTLDLNVLAKYIDQRFPTLRLIKQKAQWLHNCTMTQSSVQLFRDPNWVGRGGAELDQVCPSQSCFLFKVGKTCVSMYDTIHEYDMGFYELRLSFSGFES